LLQVTDQGGISKLPISAVVTHRDLRGIFPQGKILACDFELENAPALGAHEPYGFYLPKHDIVSIDHHADAAQMFTHVSSGNLAIEYVKACGVALPDEHVVVNHTDCDSVISSLIVKGLLPPLDVFGEAVIAADHTGAENPIADLLQAIDFFHDLQTSIACLGRLLAAEPQPEKIQKALESRLRSREETAVIIKQGDAILQEGALTVVRLNQAMCSEFLPALLPEAKLIMGFEPAPTPGAPWIARLRLGQHVPHGFHLKALKVQETIDPHFGGRWNAGANRRGGGTTQSLEDYCKALAHAVDALLA
ncbi:MAG: hypothetical protein KDD62_06535, partial [Bdellovibrionales bacterium]|nr:hypothetical protein [Bdellovibrionales bacterium]